MFTHLAGLGERRCRGPRRRRADHVGDVDQPGVGLARGDLGEHVGHRLLLADRGQRHPGGLSGRLRGRPARHLRRADHQVDVLAGEVGEGLRSPAGLSGGVTICEGVGREALRLLALQALADQLVHVGECRRTRRRRPGRPPGSGPPGRRSRRGSARRPRPRARPRTRSAISSKVLLSEAAAYTVSVVSPSPSPSPPSSRRSRRTASRPRPAGQARTVSCPHPTTAHLGNT